MRAEAGGESAAIERTKLPVFSSGLKRTQVEMKSRSPREIQSRVCNMAYRVLQARVPIAVRSTAFFTVKFIDRIA